MCTTKMSDWVLLSWWCLIIFMQTVEVILHFSSGLVLKPCYEVGDYCWKAENLCHMLIHLRYQIQRINICHTLRLNLRQNGEDITQWSFWGALKMPCKIGAHMHALWVLTVEFDATDFSCFVEVKWVDKVKCGDGFSISHVTFYYDFHWSTEFCKIFHPTFLPPY